MTQFEETRVKHALGELIWAEQEMTQNSHPNLILVYKYIKEAMISLKEIM